MRFKYDPNEPPAHVKAAIRKRHLRVKARKDMEMIEANNRRKFNMDPVVKLMKPDGWDWRRDKEPGLI